MAFERMVENIIREAMDRGEFKDLAGRGRRIDLRAYFEAPEDVRAVQAFLQNARVAPREVELLKEIWNLRRSGAGFQDADRRRELRHQIASLQLDLRTERYRRPPKTR